VVVGPRLGRRAVVHRRQGLAHDRIEDGLPDALLRAGGRRAQPWRPESAEPEPLAAAHGRPTEMILTPPTDENVAKFASYSAAPDLR
jgi:hypothetical protein